MGGLFNCRFLVKVHPCSPWPLATLLCTSLYPRPFPYLVVWCYLGMTFNVYLSNGADNDGAGHSHAQVAEREGESAIEVRVYANCKNQRERKHPSARLAPHGPSLHGMCISHLISNQSSWSPATMLLWDQHVFYLEVITYLSFTLKLSTWFWLLWS